MWQEKLSSVLDELAHRRIDPSAAETKIRELISRELGMAEVDVSRQLRTGSPEVVFGLNKSDDDILSIITTLKEHVSPVLCTKARPATFELVRSRFPESVFYEKSGAIVVGSLAPGTGRVSVISAGTSDIKVAEEAAVTAQVMGAAVETFWDVGVAGIHRLFSKLETLRKSRAIVAVAGMDGALPSVLAGLVACPVIAVPTSVGYGASFGGLAALLTMLNSCAPGVTAVNIDNGFGAGYVAALINRNGAGL
jgi:pyridinium-3,5-biscarboxylic acid mononucleotide synthase